MRWELLGRAVVYYGRFAAAVAIVCAVWYGVEWVRAGWKIR